MMLRQKHWVLLCLLVSITHPSMHNKTHNLCVRYQDMFGDVSGGHYISNGLLLQTLQKYN
jgi:hypothetical protein